MKDEVQRWIFDTVWHPETPQHSLTATTNLFRASNIGCWDRTNLTVPNILSRDATVTLKEAVIRSWADGPNASRLLDAVEAHLSVMPVIGSHPYTALPLLLSKEQDFDFLEAADKEGGNDHSGARGYRVALEPALVVVPRQSFNVQVGIPDALQRIYNAFVEFRGRAMLQVCFNTVHTRDVD